MNTIRVIDENEKGLCVAVFILKNNLFYCGDDFHLSGLFKESELLEIKKRIDNTIAMYHEKGVTDDFIRQKDFEKKQKEFEDWFKVRHEDKKDFCESHLYLILDKERNKLKIGKSKHPAKRLKQLQTANGNKLELLCVVSNKGYMEEALHKRFKDIRKCGEWFDYDTIIINYFKSLILNEEE